MKKRLLAITIVAVLFTGYIGLFLSSNEQQNIVRSNEYGHSFSSHTRADPDLVAQWHMNEGTGNSVGDSSGNGNQGTLNLGGGGNTNVADAWVHGVKGNGLDFDGVDDFLDCGNNANLEITGNITIEAWVKKNELSRIESIVSKGPYSLKVGSDNKPYIELISGSETIFDTGRLGSNNCVMSLAVYGGDLYGGALNSGRVYRYDGGTTWIDVGRLGTNDQILSLAIYNGSLYGGTEGSGRVYRYDGVNTWADVGQLGSNYNVGCLAVYGGKLYGGTGNSGRVYRYNDDTTWTDVGRLGSSSFVLSLAVYAGKLYGGTGVSSGKIYRYDGGTTWTEIGQLGSSFQSLPLAVYNGKLYGGAYDSGRIYRYDGGNTWTDVGQAGSNVRSLVVYDGKLYCCKSGSARIYRYDGGTTWTDLGQLGTENGVYSLTVYDGKLFGGTGNSGRVYSIGSGLAAYSSTTLDTEGFAYVSGSYDGTDAEIYVDSVKTGNRTGTITVDNEPFDLLIGGSRGSSKGGSSSSGEENFNGTIDEVAIHDRTLNADEIRHRYDAIIMGDHIEENEFGGRWFDDFEDETGIERKENVSVGGERAELDEGGFLDEKCLGNWKLDEGSGNVASDSSLHQNNGDIFNGATWVNGINGNGLHLDGSNDYVRVGDDNTLDFGSRQDFTIMAWFKTSNSHTGRLVYKVSNHPYNGYYLSVISGNKIQFAYFYNDNTRYIQVNRVYNDNNWHMMAGVRNGNVMKLYFDGNLVGSQQGTDNSLANSAFLYFGRDWSGGYRYNGLVDEVSMYDESLTDGQIRWLHSNPGASIYYSNRIRDSGNVVSKNITLPENMTWNSFCANRSVPDNTYLNLSIHDAVTNELLIQNTEDSDEVFADLSSMDAEEHNTIYLKAAFRSNITHTPILYNWSLNWLIKEIILSPALLQSLPPEIYVTEDTPVANLLDLSQHFFDSYSGIVPSTFAVEFNSDSGNVTLGISSSNLSVTNLAANWTGNVSIIVSCKNMHGRSTNSNKFNITVSPVNDLPAWSSAPLALILDEDKTYTSDYSLDDHILDAEDDELEFFITPESDNIIAKLESGNNITVIPSANYYGVSYVVVSVREQGQHSQWADNLTIPVAVLPVNDPPWVTLVSPGNNSTSKANSINLSWKGFDIDSSLDNLTYDLYFGNHSNPKVHASDLQVNNITIEGLEDGTRYYWYVIPNDREDLGICTNGIWSISIDSKIILPEIILRYPRDSSVLNTTSVNLTWSVPKYLGDNSTSHLYMGKTKKDMVNIHVTNNLSYHIWELADNTTYYWKVEMELEGIEGRIQSEVQSFTVKLDFIEVHELSMGFNADSEKVVRGDSVMVNMTVMNIGNMAEDVTFEVVGVLSGSVSKHEGFHLRVGEERTIDFKVFAELKLETGIYNLTIIGNYSGKEVSTSMDIRVIEQTVPITRRKESESWMWFIIAAVLFLLIVGILIFLLLKRKKDREETGEEVLDAEVESTPTGGITSVDLQRLSLGGTPGGALPFQGRLAEMLLQYKLPDPSGAYQHKTLAPAPRVTLPQLKVSGNVAEPPKALPQMSVVPTPGTAPPLTPILPPSASVAPSEPGELPALPMVGSAPNAPITPSVTVAPAVPPAVPPESTSSFPIPPPVPPDPTPSSPIPPPVPPDPTLSSPIPPPVPPDSPLSSPTSPSVPPTLTSPTPPSVPPDPTLTSPTLPPVRPESTSSTPIPPAIPLELALPPPVPPAEPPLPQPAPFLPE